MSANTSQSSILDHNGQPFKLSSRQSVRARYDLARTNSDNRRHWANADNFGPKSALDPEARRLMRSRSRLEYENSPYYCGILRTLANDTIGTGPALQCLSGNSDEDRIVESLFWEWMVATRLSHKLWTMRLAKARDGETFGILFTNERLPSPVKLDISPIEADMVADHWLGVTSTPSDGIEFDDFGNPVSYNVLDDHPGEQRVLSAGGARTIPARWMIHLFTCERPGQVRGVPELAATTQVFGKIRDFSASTMAAADTAARWAGVLHSQSSPGDPAEVEPLDEIELDPNTLLTLPRGWDISQIKQEHPATTYEMFVRAKLQEAGRPASMPYSVTACDSSTSNYSSGRLDRKVYARPLRVELAYWELFALDVIFDRWWEEARLLESFLPQRIADLQAPPSHEWRWDGEQEVDPVKEWTGKEIAIAIGVTSLQDECAKQGKDLATVQAQNAAALGMTVQEYQERLADRILGAQKSDTASVSQDVQDAVDQLNQAAELIGGRL